MVTHSSSILEAEIGEASQIRGQQGVGHGVEGEKIKEVLTLEVKNSNGRDLLTNIFNPNEENRGSVR